MDQTNTITPGVKTSEFYVTILSQVIGLLSLTGIIIPAQSAELIKAITSIVGAVVMIVPAIAYVVGRTWLKSKALPPQNNSGQ